jgi:type IX secretion system PorP/SprF family membrane protein
MKKGSEIKHKLFTLLGGKIGALLLFLSSAGFAQDFQLSQYDAPPLFLNPAMTGMFDGHYRAHVHYRTQWAAVASKPFTTAGISFDMPIKKFGVGAQVMNFSAGAGKYNVTSALLSCGYDLVFDKENNHHLALGMQAGMIQKSINTAGLTFANQYIGANGGSFDSGISSGETFSSTSFAMEDINAGFLYYYAKESSRLNPFVGFSVFHLTQPTESFFGATNTLASRQYLHGGVKINVNEKIQLLPKFLYMKQNNVSSTTASLLMHYYLKGTETYLVFGPTYRSNDAAILEFGLKKGNYMARVSYDVNTSALKATTSSRGGFEVSLTYTARKTKPNPLANCPRL